MPVGRVAREAAAHVVVHAAPRHRLQRPLRHGQRVRIAEATVQPQQQRDPHGGRELGRGPEAAVLVVEFLRVLAHRLPQLRFAYGERRAEALALAEQLGELAGAAAQPLTILAPGTGDLGEHGGEGGTPLHVVRRKVSAGEHGLELRRQEHGHRPAALAAIHRDGGGHVDLVEVGPLLAVHLDVDEVLVHQGGGRLVLEGLPLHDVAPVTGRVPDAEQDQLVLLARPLQRLLAPRIPVHRVVRVLQQIGAGLVDQPVGVLMVRVRIVHRPRWLRRWRPGPVKVAGYGLAVWVASGRRRHRGA